MTDLQRIVDELRSQRAPLRVLEAGCGSASHVDLGDDSKVVGIDLSTEQLARNVSLDEKIVGDIETYPLPYAAFDLIVCWDVLEHLPHPEKALVNFVAAIRPGGLIVLALPDVDSLKGRITKYTPHGFHVWFYRAVLGSKIAGTADHGPFKTYLADSIAPAALAAFARSHDLSVRLMHRYESSFQRRILARHRVLQLGWKLVTPVVKTLTRGRIDGNVSDVVVVLEKNLGT